MPRSASTRQNTTPRTELGAANPDHGDVTTNKTRTHHLHEVFCQVVFNPRPRPSSGLEKTLPAWIVGSAGNGFLDSRNAAKP